MLFPSIKVKMAISRYFPEILRHFYSSLLLARLKPSFNALAFEGSTTLVRHSRWLWFITYHLKIDIRAICNVQCFVSAFEMTRRLRWFRTSTKAKRILATFGFLIQFESGV